MRPSALFQSRSIDIPLVAYLALLLYVSTFPFRFAWPDASAAGLPMGTWYEAFDPMDALSNLALFIPFGYLAARRRTPIGPRGLVAVLAAALAAALLLETVQLFSPLRYASLWDVLMNGLGALAGAGLAGIAGRRAADPARLAPLALAGLWPVSLLVPPVPVPVEAIAANLQALLAIGPVTPVDLLGQAAAWAAMAHLAIRNRFAVPISPALLAPALLAATWCIQALTLAPEMPAGLVLAAIAGISLGSAPLPIPWGARLLAGLLVVHLFVDGLTPFGQLPGPAPVFWLPLHALIISNPATALHVVCEKVFLYGALFWLLRDAGIPFRATLVLGAGLLAGIEWGQRWFSVGHVAETTDPILFLGLAWLLRDAVLRAPRDAARASGTASRQGSGSGTC